MEGSQRDLVLSSAGSLEGCGRGREEVRQRGFRGEGIPIHAPEEAATGDWAGGGGQRRAQFLCRTLFFLLNTGEIKLLTRISIRYLTQVILYIIIDSYPRSCS